MGATHPEWDNTPPNPIVMSPPSFAREPCEMILLAILVILNLLLFLCVLDIVLILMRHGHVKVDETGKGVASRN